MNKIALVSGATSGIGWATAIALAEKGFSIIACGRRQERLDELKEIIDTHTVCHTLCFDIRDESAIIRAVSSLGSEWRNVDLLINNAGNAHGLSPLSEGDSADWNAMLDINVKGLLYLTKSILPHMEERNSGQIINVGSIAGKEVYPNGNVYCASKHAVDAITQGLRMELFAKGIRVASINPGLVETEFSLVRFKGDEERAKQVYQGYQALKAEDIAETITFMATRPPHVNIADVLILPSAQAGSTMVHKL